MDWDRGLGSIGVLGILQTVLGVVVGNLRHCTVI